MEVFDILGRKIEEGDYIINATSCTSSGYLRRSLVKSIEVANVWSYDQTPTYKINVKSISLKHQWGKLENGKYGYLPDLKVVRGNTYITFKESQKIDVYLLGKFDDAFTLEERQIIKKTKTKI